MEGQAAGSIKGEVALVADGVWCLEFIVVGARVWLITITGPAGSPFTWMIGCIVMFETAIALVAPITFVHEASDGGTPLVMILILEQDDFVISVRSTENEKEGMLPRQHFKLIGRVQGREVCLELAQFGQAAWSFRHPSGSMKVLGHGFLSGPSPFKCVPVAHGHVTRVIAVTMALAQHN